MTLPSGYREAVLDELRCLAPLDALEVQDVDSSVRWVEQAEEVCRLAKPDFPDKHLVSYFLLKDGDYLLLVDHINAELWLPTGGHVDPQEHPRDTVRREAFEELGLRLTDEIAAPVFITVTKTRGKTSGHTDVSLWYLLSVSREQPLIFDQSEFHSVRWFRTDEIPWHRSEPNLPRLLDKLSALDARDMARHDP